MGGPRRVDVEVGRIERAVDAAIDSRERIAVAFSAGLASLVLTMVARKRADLRCIVAGVEGSADVVAAKGTSDTLDCRVEVLLLDSPHARKIDGDLAVDHPDLSPVQRGGLVPLMAVRSMAVEIPVLTGLGATRGSPAVNRAVEQAGIRLPLRDAFRGRASRELLRSAAISLGLPESWARLHHRDPADGSGIAGSL